MPKLLIISFVEWAGAFQRPQHQAVELARRGWEVTYLGPAYPHRGAAGAGPGFDLPEGLKIEQARALPGGRIFSVIERFNEMSFQRTVAGSLGGSSAGSGQSALWDAVIFNDPRWAAAAAATRARVRVWDRMDDLSASAPTEAWGREREADALRLADLIWTGTPSLADLTQTQAREAGLERSIRFISGGVDAAHFEHPKPEAVARAREELGGGEGAAPLGLYFGAINERVNGRYLEALLDAGWRVALIGPGSSRAPRLRAAAGLRVLGPKTYDSLPAYLALADAGLIPYTTEGPNQHLYPVKAMEYLAGGKPVLSTPLPNLQRELGPYLWFGSRPADWAALAGDWKRHAAALGEQALAGQAHVRGRGWGVMAQEMIADLLVAGARVRKEGRGRAESDGARVRPLGESRRRERPKTDSDTGGKRRRGGTTTPGERLPRKRGGLTTPGESGGRKGKAGA